MPSWNGEHRIVVKGLPSVRHRRPLHRVHLFALVLAELHEVGVRGLNGLAMCKTVVALFIWNTGGVRRVCVAELPPYTPHIKSPIDLVEEPSRVIVASLGNEVHWNLAFRAIRPALSEEV